VGEDDKNHEVKLRSSEHTIGLRIKTDRNKSFHSESRGNIPEGKKKLSTRKKKAKNPPCC